MKRFSKILVAVLALCLLVGALALAISANYDEPSFEGKPFVVKGVGYDSWDIALEKAANAHTIYLNDDWSLTSGLQFSGKDTKVKINLNGHTVNYSGTSAIMFNVYDEATFVIEGEGTFNNVPVSLIGGTQSADITVNANGSGIAINHFADTSSTNYSTFRVYDKSTLAVSGKIDVRQDVKGGRYIFNLDRTVKTVDNKSVEIPGAKQFDINDAKITLLMPNVSGCKFAFLITVAHHIDITINNSELTTYYGLILSNTYDLSKNDVTNFVATSEDGKTLGWTDADAAAKGVDLIDANVKITANDSKFASYLNTTGKTEDNYDNKTTYNGGSYTSMFILQAAVKGDFERCDFYGDERFFVGNNGTFNAKAVSNTQLSFKDCNLDRIGHGSQARTVFVYGLNVKWIGGSIGGGYFNYLTTGNAPYLELKDGEGKLTGEWVGAYFDNVLFYGTFANVAPSATGSWYNAFSTAKDALAQSKTYTEIRDGKTYSFSGGYFSDKAMFDKFNTLNSFYRKTDGTYTTEYKKVDGGKATGNPNMGFSIQTVKGTWQSLNENGNGYLRFSYDNTAGTDNVDQDGSNFVIMDTGYSNASFDASTKKLTAGKNNLFDYSTLIYEFDVRSTTGYFPEFALKHEARATAPIYDESGNVTGVYGENNYNGAPCATNVYIKQTSIGGVDVSATIGDWHRVTIVYDVKIKETTVTGTWQNGSTLISEIPEGVEIKGYDFTESKMHFYLDGQWIDSYSLVGTNSFFDGAIPADFAAGFHIQSVRFTPTHYAGKNNSIDIDNYRVSVYERGIEGGLGLYDENGEIRENIYGLDQFMVMPTDNLKHLVNPYFANVDGKDYLTESEALAAIKANSVVKLYKDLTAPVEAGVSFTLYPNGNEVPGFISSTHKVVDCTASLGYYKLVSASADEKFTVNYIFEGDKEPQTYAMGTIITEAPEFKMTVKDGVATYVAGWTLPVSEYSDYKYSNNVFDVEATTATKTGFKLATSTAVYDDLATAVKEADGDTITVYADIVAEPYQQGSSYGAYVDGVSVTINLNGKTIEAATNVKTIFNVVNGGTLTLNGAATFNNVFTIAGAEGASVLNINADGASTGIVINSRRLEAKDTDIATFRIHDRAILNVSGKITLNTTNGTRYLFNLTAGNGTKGAAQININRAKIYVPLPEEKGCGYGSIIATHTDIEIDIKDSELEIEYGQIIFSNEGGTLITYVSEYKKDKINYNASETTGVSAAIGVGKIFEENYNPNVFITASGSTFKSGYHGYSTYTDAENNVKVGTQSSKGTLFTLQARTDLKFDNCVLYCSYRTIMGKDSSNAQADFVHLSQFLFTDCDFLTMTNTTKGGTQNPGNEEIFHYGCNYKIQGGSISFPIANGSSYYLAFENEDGTPTGHWAGGFIDNVLLATDYFFYDGVLNDADGNPRLDSKGKTPVITGNWLDSTATVAGSKKVGTITLTIDGVSRKFVCGYFSDATKYQAIVDYANDTKDYVISVDGVRFETVAEANAVIKKDSVVELLKDVTDPIEVNAENVKFVANGFYYPGFVSASQTTLDFTAARGAYYFIPADDSIIFTITYSYNETEASQIAVLGTLLKVPSVFDELSKPDLDEANKKYTFIEWPIEDGAVATGDTVIVASLVEKAAAVINWLWSNGEVICSNYYYPGSVTELEYTGEDELDTAPEYYSWFRGETDWNAEDLAAASAILANGGEISIHPVMRKVSPDVFPGLQVNVSIYGNYALNIYVPQEIEGVSVKTVAIDKEGRTSFTKFAPGSIDGVAYDRYGYVLGPANTETYEFYLIYTVDGTEIKYSINTSVPEYAAKVLYDYKDRTDAKALLVKELVVNMANYADKYLSVVGDDKTSLGAQIYTAILQKYDGFLTRYNALEDDMFADDSAILNAALEMKNKAEAVNPEKTKEALTYVDAFSMEFNRSELAFVLKLSEKAVAAGISKPKDDKGGTQNLMLGVHLYAGWGGSTVPTIMWAEPAGSNDKLYGNANVWLENGNYSDYEYFAKTTNNEAWNATAEGKLVRQGWFKIKDIRTHVCQFTIYNGVEGSLNKVVGDVYYTFQEYINSLVNKVGENPEYRDELDAAKALYALSEAASAYYATTTK